MRDKKVRAWDKVKGEYLYSDKFPSMWQFYKELENRGIRHFETEDYTGLKDKNGKEIYEGDICQHTSGEPEINSVEYYCGEWHLEPHGLHLADEDNQIEVIGNIYESPHLLDNNSGSY